MFCNKLTIIILINHYKKISVPNEVHLDLVRNSRILPQYLQLFVKQCVIVN